MQGGFGLSFGFFEGLLWGLRLSFQGPVHWCARSVAGQGLLPAVMRRRGLQLCRPSLLYLAVAAAVLAAAVLTVHAAAAAAAAAAVQWGHDGGLSGR